VGQHLGVGVGGEGHPVGGQAPAQLGGVLDDAVVDHRHVARRVDVGVGVGVGRLAVGRPAGVADAGGGGQAPGKGGGQVGHPPGPLVDLQPGPAEEGDAGRVVAPVLQSLQALQEDGRGRLRADVADDPTHVSLLISSVYQP
jgi:hypothetical protein